MEPKPHNQYTTDESTPFTLNCGDPVARIHHDAGRVPYLLLLDEQGNSWRIYGYAQVACKCGGGGEWHPGRDALERMLKNKQSRRMMVDLLLQELESDFKLR